MTLQQFAVDPTDPIRDADTPAPRLIAIEPAQVHEQLARHLLVDGFRLVLDTAKSHGSWLVDARTGESYLDLYTFFASAPLGLNHPDIVDDRSRDLLDAIAGTGGLVGIIAYSQPDVDAFIDDIDYVIRAVGPDHVALGTDFFGMERAPAGFTTMAELPNLTARLVERGYADDVIRKILGENYLRVFSQVWR